jgi:hypothetical protein
MKTKWRILFGVITLTIVIYLLRKIDFLSVRDLIIEANNYYFFLAFLSYLVSFLVFDFRTKYSMKNIVVPGFFFNLKVTLAGFFVNTVTPGAQLGGDPVRAYYLGKKYKKSKSKIFGALLADRFFHVAASLFFILASLLFVLTFFPVSYELKTIFQATLFVIILVSLIMIYFSFRKANFNIELFFQRFRWLFPRKNKGKGKTKLERILIKHFNHFAKTFRNVVKDKKIILVGILLSLTYWILNFSVSYFLFLSFGVEISFLIVIVVFCLGNIVGDISPSPGGIGLIEGVSIIAYSLFGVSLAAAVTVSLLTRVIFYFFSILLGGWSLINLEKTVK